MRRHRLHALGWLTRAPRAHGPASSCRGNGKSNPPHHGTVKGSTSCKICVWSRRVAVVVVALPGLVLGGGYLVLRTSLPETSGTIDKRLAELGIELPKPSAAAAKYAPYVVSGNQVFVAGRLNATPGGRLVLTFTIPWCGGRRSEVIRSGARPAVMLEHHKGRATPPVASERRPKGCFSRSLGASATLNHAPASPSRTRLAYASPPGSRSSLVLPRTREKQSYTPRNGENKH